MCLNCVGDYFWVILPWCNAYGARPFVLHKREQRIKHTYGYKSLILSWYTGA